MRAVVAIAALITIVGYAPKSNAAEFTAAFAIQVCEAWRVGHEPAIALLESNGWSSLGPVEGADAGPLENEPEWRRHYFLQNTSLRPPDPGPGSGVRPRFTVEEATFGPARVTRCEVFISLANEPFMSLDETQELLGSTGFRGQTNDVGRESLDVQIVRSSRIDAFGATWATVATWHPQAFPQNKYWRLRFQAIHQLDGRGAQ